MTSFSPTLTWASGDQYTIFHTLIRFVVLAAGRRWGKTKGAFHLMVELCLEMRTKHLWVDTRQSNIDKYYDEHLEPLLRLMPGLFKWNKQAKVLKFYNGSEVHFGSAERPEKLEGFGYGYIWLNEAGIILKAQKGRSLWRNTIRPMSMEEQEGKGGKKYLPRVFFIGTPKGVGLFADFIDRGNSDDEQWDDWATFHRTSYDRPSISDEEIAAVMEEYGSEEDADYRQEILAEVVTAGDGAPVIRFEVVREAADRKVEADSAFVVVWGVDPSGEGEDAAGLAKRRGQTLLEPTKVRRGRMDSEVGAQWIKSEWDEAAPEDRPKEIIVDSIGMGEGWVTQMRALGLPARGVNWAKAALRREKYYQRRDELWKKGGAWCETGSLAGDRDLMRELALPLIDRDFLEKGKVKVESKKAMRLRLGSDGKSPNRADAFLLTFAAGIERDTERQDRWRNKKPAVRDTSWMAA